MDILEQYQRILAEICQCARLVKGEIIGRSASEYGIYTTTFSLGKYHSKILNNEVYIALKQGSSGIKQRVIDELSVIRFIAQHYPELIPKLPLFLGLLEDNDKIPLGVITEDFSTNNAYKVQEGVDDGRIRRIREFELIKMISSLLTSTPEHYDILKMCFLVNGQLRLGDFDSLPYLTEDETRREELLGRSGLEREIERFTVRISYDI